MMNLIGAITIDWSKIFEVALAILGIIFIVLIGAVIVVFLADLLLFAIDKKSGIFFKRKVVNRTVEEKDNYTEIVQDKTETVETELVTDYTYNNDLAIEEEEKPEGVEEYGGESTDEWDVKTEPEATAEEIDESKNDEIAEILKTYEDVVNSEPEIEEEVVEEVEESNEVIGETTTNRLVEGNTTNTNTETTNIYIIGGNKQQTSKVQEIEEEEIVTREEWERVKKELDGLNSRVIIIESEKNHANDEVLLRDQEISRLNSLLAQGSANRVVEVQVPVEVRSEEDRRTIDSLHGEIERLRMQLSNISSESKVVEVPSETDRVTIENLKAENAKLNSDLNKLALDREDTVVVTELREELIRIKKEKTEAEQEQEKLRQQIILIQNQPDNYYNITKIGAYTEEELEEKIRLTEEKLKANNKNKSKVGKEYIPLARVEKTLESDQKKLRRKEAIVAKKNVILYGVNNYVDMDSEKAKEIEEDQILLDGLRASVRNCEEILLNNKDRLPILKNSYEILVKHEQQVMDELNELKAALAELRERKENQ